MSQTWRSQIKKKKRPSSRTFLSLGTIIILGPENPYGGLSCSLKDGQQHPWPLPTKCQQHTDLIINHDVSRCCQTSPGSQHDLQLESTDLVDTPPVHTIWEDFQAGPQSQKGGGAPSGTRVLGTDGNTGASSRRT